MIDRDRTRKKLDDLQVIGWIEAAAFVIAVSTLNVLYAYAIATGANVIVFVLYALIGASAVMLITSGIGRDVWAIIKAPQSSIYGGASVALEAIYFLLVGLISPAEASLTARLSVPASLLIGWSVFSSHISHRQVLGGLIVIAAVVPVLAWVAPDKRAVAVALGVLCALAVAVKTFASEFHPWNRAADSIAEKIRVTGLVILATTVLGFAATVIAMLAVRLGCTSLAAVAPPLSAFAHGPTILLALVFGTAILTAMSFLQFSSVVKIGTANFLAMTAFAPLTAYALQTLAASVGLIVVQAFDWAMLVPILTGIAGVLLIVEAGNGQGTASSV